MLEKEKQVVKTGTKRLKSKVSFKRQNCSLSFSLTLSLSLLEKEAWFENHT